MIITMLHVADAFKAEHPTYNVDTGPLSLPEHIRIGKLNHAGDKILNYGMQVDEYAVWLEDQIKAEDPIVCLALEEIFLKAQTTGITLTTVCMPSPYITHAHQIIRAIKELAGETP